VFGFDVGADPAEGAADPGGLEGPADFGPDPGGPGV
jgi:hypothetical protein